MSPKQKVRTEKVKPIKATNSILPQSCLLLNTYFDEH